MKNDEEDTKIDLSLEIKDFGPITGGKLRIKHLTLFIGPNNSGKSYAAMLIHSLFKVGGSAELGMRIPFGFRGRPPLFRPFESGRSWRKNDTKELQSFLKGEIETLKEGNSIEIPDSLVEKITNAVSDKIYEERLGKEIVSSYSAPLGDLVRIGARSFLLKIGFNSEMVSLGIHKNNLTVTEYPSIDFKIKIEPIDGTEIDWITAVNESGKYRIIQANKDLIEIEDDETRRALSILINEILNEILRICIQEVAKKLDAPSYYLPAARSGILQSHKLAAAGMMRKIPLIGVEKMDIPKFSGVVAEFMASILDLPEDKGTFYSLAEEFEKELIKGEIIVQTLDSYTYPEIQYRFSDTNIPLHRSSSTVSELAPLILYLKYIVEPRSILIIEEPEAHLHPKNQRILARFLVKLIRRGVNIIITTHSEYLLEQLSNFIMIGKIEAKDRVERYGYDEEDYLTIDDIAAFVFDMDDKSGGSTIKEVEITAEDGISQEEFVKIQDVLYDEIIGLRKDLNVE
ncbi:hypothetical protein DRN85_08965 [Methanosarcinales archaeon]|nr:MAG: hypothetical protein DRN85_08965 [Methanosarcinales archaeon]